MIIRSGRIDQVIELARRYADEAGDAIAKIPGAGPLSKFPPSYVEWALEEFVAA
jgi:hypothetical protein